VLKRDLHDDPDNRTRFALIARVAGVAGVAS
jgi:prephenate dehydratase